MAPAGEVMVNLRDVTRNVMAREKALYDGHAVAAVAATSEAIAREALGLIEVDYEVLPHVIDVDGAINADAPICMIICVPMAMRTPPTRRPTWPSGLSS